MTCQFHPSVKADNHCQHCHKKFCVQCSNEVNIERGVSDSHSCFICGGELELISKGSNIIPFWSRIGEIYRYPLHTQAVLAIIVIAVFSAMLSGWGLLALGPAIAIYLYSFACLKRTAEGDNEAPGIEASFEGSVMPVIYVIICMILALITAVLVFMNLGAGFGVLVSFFFVMVMPAAIIMIAIEERLLPALNIGNLIGILKGTGISYGVMVLFLMLMLSSMAVLGEMFGNTNFHSLSVFFSALIGNYYSIVMFHIMGYLVYQNHQELGYRVTGKAGVKQNKKRTAHERQKAQFELLVKAGEFESAREVAKGSLTENSHIWEWERAFKLFCAAKPSNDVDVYFDRYIKKLNAMEEQDKVAEAYLLLIRAKPDFVITGDLRKLDVAEALSQLRKHKQAITLIRSLPQESQDSEIVERSLKLLGDSFGQLPGNEKHAENFQTMHALHVARSKV